MAINDGDVFSVKFCQKVLGRDVCMVWTITTENPTGIIDITELAEWVRDTIAPFIHAAQSASVVGGSILVENLTDGNTFAEVAMTGTGAMTGEDSPPFVAAGIRLSRSTKATRNGYKRLPGLVETVIEDGEFIPAYVTGQLEPLANALSSSYAVTMADSDTVQIAPVIVGRVETAPDSGIYVYDLTKLNPITGYVVNTTATSQVSRKK